MSLTAKTKILVVDDLSVMRKIIKNMLLNMGYSNIYEASDGAPAWQMIQEAAQQEPFGFVVSDWNMPAMSGVELVKKIRANEKLKSLPVLVITAQTEQSSMVDAVRAGVSHFLVKPFSATSLQEKMQKIFEK